ncbi:hypothetical protein GBAR_LOCUS14107 [Geodia barretti]|uniref:Uncharacterized protein n=1 Tax=Geodia barretti TaxID=519541 RepID=A0AA35S840_GEOBA|nr:hypothetical protein GBAR_LOCUS14107 [Geodia barretti]
MLHIVTSDSCSTDPQWTLSAESTVPLSQLPLSPSQLNTPPFEHSSSPPSTSPWFLSSSQPTTSLAGLHPSSPPHYPHSSSTPHLHSVSHPLSSPQSHLSPSHSQPSTSPRLQKTQVSQTSLPHHTSHTSPLHSQLSPPSHQQLSTSPKFISRSTSPLPPPIPPKPETSDSDHDTATGSSYCILMKGPPQLPLVTPPENTSSNKQEIILQSLLGQPLNQEATQSPGETAVTQTGDSPSFLEDSLSQNTRANGEELSPPPRPPKPTPSSPKTGKPAPPTPPLAEGSTSSSGRKTRAPPIPWDPAPSPPSLLPPRPGQREGGRRSEGSVSLPPRHIRRYPLSSSSGSTPGPGSGPLDQGDGEEEVFLKYNQSYHTITKFFHTDRLHTQ